MSEDTRANESEEERMTPVDSIDTAINLLTVYMVTCAEARRWGYVDNCNIQIRKLVETRNLLPVSTEQRRK